MLEELYQEEILDASKSTRFRGDLQGVEGAKDALVNNPLCGDNVHLWVKPSENKLECVCFSGHGCSISQASASMLSELVQGRSTEEAKIVVEAFKKLLAGKIEDSERELLHSLVALEGVRRFPARARCASIAFEALSKILEQISKNAGDKN